MARADVPLTIIAPFVAESPNNNSGYPTVAGTRIPVRTLVLEHSRLSNGLLPHQKIDSLKDTHPTLSHRQIEAALAFFETSPVRVIEDQKRNELGPESLRLNQVFSR